MSSSPRQVVKAGKQATIWLVTLPGSSERQYFVEGRGIRLLHSQNFGSLPEANEWFEALERDEPLHSLT